MQTTFDRRRINGPDESFAPVFDDEEDNSRASTSKVPLKSRTSRGPFDVRPIFLKTGLISQANGSAYIETEKTKIACAVYGPRQSKSTTYHERGRLNVEVKFSPFSCEQRRTPMKDAEDRPVSQLIQQSLLSAIRLELLPKSTVDIYIIVIECDGTEGCVASGTIAASTALAHAGIEMLGIAVSCSAALMTTAADKIWLDPTNEEAKEAKGCCTVACVPALGLVTNVWQTGQMKAGELLLCMEACQERCLDIHSVVVQSLLDANISQ